VSSAAAGANVQQLIEEQGAVRGVAYRGADGPCELRAPLTVAADGRFSRLRKLAGLEGVTQSAPMEVIWLRLPRKADDPREEGGARQLEYRHLDEVQQRRER
jgi:2-polyprenyl-6-methoxyphenol hydroxylase-like FAD-dependent oxidoreductase